MSAAIESRQSYSVSTPILPEEDLRWCTVMLSEIVNRNNRFEASVFDLVAKQAREKVFQSRWPVVNIWGDTPFAKKVFVPGRVKRIYVDKNVPGAVGFLGSAEMLDVRPIPFKWLLKDAPQFSQFLVEKGWVLLSCSGTIGNVVYVSDTLSHFLVSQHAIRIVCDYPGYMYSFLKTTLGRVLVNSNKYGAVISEIEPDHLGDIPLPRPSSDLQIRIHNLIVQSYDLRDESNALFAEAEKILLEALRAQPLEQLQPRYLDEESNGRIFEVKLSETEGRLDASYHIPLINTILQSLKGTDLELATIGDSRVSERIVLPGHFKRIYSSQALGIPLIGGRELYELDAGGKYLASSQYSEKLKSEILIKENMILISAKGTVGKVVLVPKHWDGWAISSNIISVVPSSSDIAGYLYVFLSSPYGQELINRNIYGAVVDIIEPCHVAQVQIPILKDKVVQKQINDLALEANQKRYNAYLSEKQAINMVNNQVLNQDQLSSSS